MPASKAFGGGKVVYETIQVTKCSPAKNLEVAPDFDGRHSFYQMLASKAFGGGADFYGRIRKQPVHPMLASKAVGGGVRILMVV